MNIDDASLKTIVAKAIFDGITPEQRQELMTKAIGQLLTTPQVDRYGGPKQPTPLQSLFEYEVQNMAREAIRERFKTDPEVHTLISGIVTKAIAAMAQDDNIGVEIGNAIAKALQRANQRD